MFAQGEIPDEPIDPEFVGEPTDGDLEDMYEDDRFKDDQYGSGDDYGDLDFDETWN